MSYMPKVGDYVIVLPLNENYKGYMQSYRVCRVIDLMESHVTCECLARGHRFYASRTRFQFVPVTGLIGSLVNIKLPDGGHPTLRKLGEGFVPPGRTERLCKQKEI